MRHSITSHRTQFGKRDGLFRQRIESIFDVSAMRRKLREMGERHSRFMAQTSFFPGTAFVTGRQRLELKADLPWRAVAIGVVLFVALIAVHQQLFGGYPLR